VYLGTANATNVVITDAHTGNVIQNGSQLYNPADDSGAFFTLQVSGTDAYINLLVSFTYIDQTTTHGFIYEDTFELENGTFNLPFPGLGGQTVTIQWTDVCAGSGGASISFVVKGTNSAPSQVQGWSQRWFTPWFWPQLLNQESFGLQYAASTFSTGSNGTNTNQNVIGMPLWGSPDGIGIGQFDGSTYQLSYSDYFSTNQNIQDSLGELDSYQQPAIDYINSQVTVANSYGDQPPAYNIPGQNCGTFGTGGNRPLSDAEWMTKYNGGNVVKYVPPTATTPSNWSPRLEYVTGVCSQNPLY